MSHFLKYLTVGCLALGQLLLGSAQVHAQKGGGGGGRSGGHSGGHSGANHGSYHGNNYHGNYHGGNGYNHGYYPGFYGLYLTPSLYRYGYGYDYPYGYGGDYAYSFYPPPVSSLVEPLYPPPNGNLPPNGSLPRTNIPARVEVLLPTANAQLWFDGQAMSETGGNRRVFNTPPLEPGYDYSYQVVAVWMQDGEKVRVERTVQLRPGQMSRVDFSRVDASERPPSDARPTDARPTPKMPLKQVMPPASD